MPCFSSEVNVLFYFTLWICYWVFFQKIDIEFRTFSLPCPIVLIMADFIFKVRYSFCWNIWVGTYFCSYTSFVNNKLFSFYFENVLFLPHLVDSFTKNADERGLKIMCKCTSLSLFVCIRVILHNWLHTFCTLYLLYLFAEIFPVFSNFVWFRLIYKIFILTVIAQN